jgi:hypothetical protein
MLSLPTLRMADAWRHQRWRKSSTWECTAQRICQSRAMSPYTKYFLSSHIFTQDIWHVPMGRDENSTNICKWHSQERGEQYRFCSLPGTEANITKRGVEKGRKNQFSVPTKSTTRNHIRYLQHLAESLRLRIGI